MFSLWSKKECWRNINRGGGRPKVKSAKGPACSLQMKMKTTNMNANTNININKYYFKFECKCKCKYTIMVENVDPKIFIYDTNIPMVYFVINNIFSK